MLRRKSFAFRMSIDRRKSFQHVQNIKLEKIIKIYHYTATVLRHLKFIDFRKIRNEFVRIFIYDHYK